MTLKQQKSRRRGLSLLEVLVALAIFLVSLIGIGQLVSFGGDRARDVQQQAQATQLCQAKLAEVVAGAVPVSGSSSGAFDEDPRWEWTVESQPGNISGLWTVTVRVSRQRPDGSRLESSLSQMVLDPSLRGSPASSSSAASSEAAGAGASGSAAASGSASGPASSSSGPSRGGN